MTAKRPFQLALLAGCATAALLALDRLLIPNSEEALPLGFLRVLAEHPLRSCLAFLLLLFGARGVPDRPSEGAEGAG